MAQLLTHFSQNIIAGEQDMQLKYRDYFEQQTDSGPGCVIVSYVGFLKSHVEKAKLPVALCCVLPCFWIYYQLGAIERHPNQLVANPYKEWIATYSSTDFIQATKQLSKEINHLAHSSDAETKDEMIKVFSKAVQFELDFFDDCFYSDSPKLSKL